jgi:hypothetical protein
MKKAVMGLLALFMLIGCATTQKEDLETVFYPALPQEPRIQFLMSITSEKDIGKEESSFKQFLLGETQSVRQVSRPYGIATAPGKIFISDRTLRKILIVDLVQQKFDYIRDEGEGSLDQPAGIWITPSGDLYVSDFGRRQVLVFDAAYNYVRTYGDVDQFSKPLDVVVNENRIYVCDFNTHEIIVVDKESGETVQIIGGEGAEEGRMFKPTHLSLDRDGNIYVTDSFNFRIQKFNPDGNFEKIFGYQGDTLGGFARPKGVAVSDDGLIYAVDTAFENVQIFDNDSALLLLYFGEFGPNPGSMYLPNSVHIDYDNVKYFQKYADKDFSIKYLIYVGNMLGDHKVNIYGFGEWTGKPLPKVPRKRIKLD